jgi:branched-chain amino acid transport system ATP-binding protein/sulfate-transporting ATPase
MTDSGALLDCRDLTVKFGGLTALNALNLSAQQNEILGLIGPNGSGKTTFFNVVTGIYSAASGETSFEGHHITRLSPQAIYHSGVARTFQRSRLCLPLSVLDNIMVGDYQHFNHGVLFNLFCRKSLRKQYEQNYSVTKELLQTFNEKLAERLFEPITALNMIDRRRVEICRALISRPKLLLLDEPSAGMTHDETRELMDDILQVRERMAGLTIIIIEHEMNVIERITDRCIVINYGQKIAEGTYAEVAADKEVQQAYLGQD